MEQRSQMPPRRAALDFDSRPSLKRRGRKQIANLYRSVLVRFSQRELNGVPVAKRSSSFSGAHKSAYRIILPVNGPRQLTCRGC